MTDEEIFATLKKVFVEIFEDDTEITLQTSPDDVKAWDSMGQMKFMAGLEKAFSIKFKMKDIVGATSIGKIIESIRARKEG